MKFRIKEKLYRIHRRYHRTEVGNNDYIDEPVDWKIYTYSLFEIRVYTESGKVITEYRFETCYPKHIFFVHGKDKLLPKDVYRSLQKAEAAVEEEKRTWEAGRRDTYVGCISDRRA